MSRITPGRAFLWIAGAALAGGGLAHWLAVSPESGEVLTPIREDRWGLPEPLKPLDLNALYARLHQSKPWGEAEKPPSSENPGQEATAQAENKKNTPDWRFSGIVSSGGQRYMLLLNPEDQKAQRFAPPEVLPDQSVLRSVAQDSVEIERDGQAEVWRLYQPQK